MSDTEQHNGGLLGAMHDQLRTVNEALGPVLYGDDYQAKQAALAAHFAVEKARSDRAARREELRDRLATLQVLAITTLVILMCVAVAVAIGAGVHWWLTL